MELRIKIIIISIFATFQLAFADVDFIKTKSVNLPVVNKNLLQNVHSKHKLIYKDTGISDNKSIKASANSKAITHPGNNSAIKTQQTNTDKNKTIELQQASAPDVTKNPKDIFMDNEVKMLFLPEPSVVLNHLTSTGMMHELDPQQVANHVLEKIKKHMLHKHGKKFVEFLRYCNQHYGNSFNKALHKQMNAKNLLQNLKEKTSSVDIISVLKSYPELLNVYINNQNIMLWALNNNRYFITKYCYVNMSKIPIDSDWFIRRFFILSHINENYDELKYIFFKLLQANINRDNFITNKKNL